MYEAVFSDEFKKQLSKIKSKDKILYERLEKKIRSILLEPTHLKHLKNVLKGQQRVQLGSFVLKFVIKENKVYFIIITHHDFAYWNPTKKPELNVTSPSNGTATNGTIYTPIINTTRSDNLTISSASGSVIIRLG